LRKNNLGSIIRGMKSLFRIAALLTIGITLLGLPAVGQTLEKTNACNLSASLDGVTVTTQIVAAPPLTSTTVNINGTPTVVNTGSQRIKICGVNMVVNQTTTAANYGLAYGTGSNCATGTTNVTPQWVGTVSVKDRWDANFGVEGPLILPAGKALCLKLSAAPTGAQVLIRYKLEP
jgi:hypothetical protein